jgi:two-component system, LytTR family, response regulator
MINCLVADDEPLALKLIEGYVQKTPFLNLVASCSNAFDALKIIEGEQINLMFLDIQMPGLSGMELARSLTNGPRVIFTTAFENYAIQGYKVDAIDYLLKPFSYEEFLLSANKARQVLESSNTNPKVDEIPNHIIVKSDYKLLQLPLNDILFIEGLKDYAKFYLESEPKPVMSLMSMKSLEEKLPTGQFMRIHRSYIVNINKIKTIERNRIIFGTHYLPVSDKYKDAFEAFIAKRFF